MAATVYLFEVRDAGTLTDSLSPVWVNLYRLSDGVSVSSPSGVAPIGELGEGLYKVTYDPEGASGELAGVIDAGVSITDNADRYISVSLAQDSSRLINLSTTLQGLGRGFQRSNTLLEVRPSTDPF